MDKETQHAPTRIYWDIRAADALERARMLPPGPERNEALKRASLLRCTADARGVTFAKRGRPPKQISWRSAAPANASDDPVNVFVVLIKGLLRCRCGGGNIGGTRLAVANPRGPGPGCLFVSRGH